jgi:hypothetical protein
VADRTGNPSATVTSKENVGEALVNGAYQREPLTGWGRWSILDVANQERGKCRDLFGDG